MVVISILTWILLDMAALKKVLAGSSQIWSFFGKNGLFLGIFGSLESLKIFQHEKIGELMIDCGCMRYF